MGRVTFALIAWKRLPYALDYHKKQIYGLSNECKKGKNNKKLLCQNLERSQAIQGAALQGNACAGL